MNILYLDFEAARMRNGLHAGLHGFVMGRSNFFMG